MMIKQRQCKAWLICALALLLLVLVIVNASAAQKRSDPKEGAGSEERSFKQPFENHDRTDETVSRGKWMPLPIFLTEPAFGYGLGLGLGYIHPPKEGIETEAVPSLQTPTSVESGRHGQKPPPDITGVAGGYTEKETGFGAVGHSASWRDDTIRYVGALAYADVKSTYYILDRPLDFDLQGFALLQDLKFRLGNSRFFLGGKLLYLETESEFDITVGDDTDITIDDISSRNFGVAAEVSFDGRDNVFTPNSGQLFQLAAWRHDEGLGGDYNYWSSTLKILSFINCFRSSCSDCDWKARPWMVARHFMRSHTSGCGVSRLCVTRENR
jgi:hypothetical protein